MKVLVKIINVQCLVNHFLWLGVCVTVISIECFDLEVSNWNTSKKELKNKDESTEEVTKMVSCLRNHCLATHFKMSG